MKREVSVVPTKIARFTNQVVSITQKGVTGAPRPAFQPGEGGYADWVIAVTHGLNPYLDLVYRRLLNALSEMPRICRILDLELRELPVFALWRKYGEIV